MKNKLLLIFFLSVNTLSFAQNQVRIDSLLTQLKSVGGTSRIDVLNELSWEYRSLQPEKSIEYGEMALKSAFQKNYNKGIAKAFRYLGTAYRLQFDFIKAQKYFYQSLVFEEKTKNKLGIAECLNNIGEVYKYRGNYKEALDKYRKAVKIFEELGVKQGTVSALSNIADTYYRAAKYKNALTFAMQSLNIAREIGTNEGMKEASLILSEAYAKMGSYNEAYDFLTMYNAVKDSVFTSEKKREIDLLEKRFARELQEAEAKRIKEKQDELDRNRKQQRDNIQYSLIFIFFVILFVGIFTIGKYDIHPRVVEILIFITALTIFRFILISLMPVAEFYFGGGPFVTLASNVVIGLFLLPFHKFLEARLKRKAIKTDVPRGSNAPDNSENSGKKEVKVAE